MFKKLSKALGLSGDNADVDNDEYTPYDDVSARKPYINPFKKEETAETASTKSAGGNTVDMPMPEISKVQGLPVEFLDTVVEIINGNLPQIVKDNLNLESEKESLAKTIEPHFKAVLDSVHDAAVAEAREAWENDVKEVNEKISKLTATAAEQEKRATDARQKLQIEEAKRRALADKGEEQKARIATLEAEKEQYEIENKSLLNKIKVMQVYADDSNTYKEQLNDRDNLITALNAKLTEADQQAKNTAAEIQKIRAELKEATTALEAAAEVEQNLQQAKELEGQYTQEIEQLKDQVDQLNKQLEASAAQAVADAEKLTADMDALKREQAEQIKSLSESNAAAIATLTAESEARIDKLTSEHKTKVDELVNECKATVEELAKERSARKDESAEHTKEVKFLKAQWKRTESELRQQIKELSERKPTIGLPSAVATATPMSPAAIQATLPAEPDEFETPAMLQPEPLAAAEVEATFSLSDSDEPIAAEHKSDVLDDLDDIDWVMPEPSAEPQQDSKPDKSEEELKEAALLGDLFATPQRRRGRPRKKKSNDDDKQMSLF